VFQSHLQPSSRPREQHTEYINTVFDHVSLYRDRNRNRNRIFVYSFLLAVRRLQMWPKHFT